MFSDVQMASCYWCGYVFQSDQFDVYCLEHPVFGKRLTIHVCGKRIKQQYKKGTLARKAIDGCKAAVTSEGYVYRADLTRAERLANKPE